MPSDRTRARRARGEPSGRSGAGAWLWLALVALLVGCTGIGLAARSTSAPEHAAPYVPTPEGIVDQMLTLAAVGPADYVVDLGSGDGRLVITAVTKYHARGGFGVDIDPALVKRANENAARAGVADRVRFYERDLFTADVKEATVVTVYLLPAVMGRVEKKLRSELRSGARVVTHDYSFPEWPPKRTIELDSLDKIKVTGQTYTVLWLYTVP